MNKFTPILGISALALTGYIATKPYVVVENIKTGFVNNDAVMLAENIDYTALRQNIKDQMNALMMKSAAEGARDNPFASLASGLATMMTDKLVDSMLSPGGMAAIMSKNKSSDGNSPPKDPNEVFNNARLGYDSIDHFSIWFPAEDGKEVRMVLQRNGIDWKLVNIIMPI